LLQRCVCAQWTARIITLSWKTLGKNFKKQSTVTYACKTSVLTTDITSYYSEKYKERRFTDLSKLLLVECQHLLYHHQHLELAITQTTQQLTRLDAATRQICWPGVDMLWSHPPIPRQPSS